MSNSSPESQAKRVNRREFTQRFAKRAGVPVRVATAVYEAMIEELLEIVNSGETVTLSGFGKFYPQKHKGHAVTRFPQATVGAETVDDYTVLKFSATRTVNKKVKAPTE